MHNIVKRICLCLALMLCFSLMSTPAFAATAIRLEQGVG